MLPRMLQKESRCQVARGELQVKYRAGRMRRPLVSKSRCWRLVSDQLRLASGKTSRRKRLPTSEAMTPGRQPH
jgi:hypothetical protein